MIDEVQTDSLIQNLHTAIASPETIDTELFRDDLVAYNDLCFDLNTHLSAAERMLEQGMRDDAIALSDREGNLLHQFHVLDFPERNLLGDLAAFYSLPISPELNAEAAASLNMAYAVLEDLGSLLNHHRTLALARAPLTHRIKILNILAKRDPENPIWSTDAATFQKSRLGELVNEVDGAIKDEDFKTLNALYQELTQSRWWIKVPPKLIAKVKVAKNASVRRDQIDEIKELEARLSVAHANQDVASASRIAQQITKLGSQADLTPDDPVFAPISEALNWLHQQQALVDQQLQDQRIIETLKQTLFDTSSRNKLHQALRTTKSKLNDRMPGALTDEVLERINALDRRDQRKRWMVIGSAALTVVFLVTMLGGFLTYRAWQSGLASLDTEFGELIQEEKWDVADQFFKNQTDSVRSRPAFVAGSAVLQVEQQRAEKFLETLGLLQSDTPGLPKSNLLKQLQAVATTEDDQRHVRMQVAVQEEQRKAERKRIVAEEEQKLEALKVQVDQVLRTSSMHQEKLKAELDRVHAFREDSTVTTYLFRITLDRMEKKLSKAIEGCSKSDSSTNAIRRITETIGVVEDFQVALTSHAGQGDSWSLSDKEIEDRIQGLRSDLAWAETIDHRAFRDLSKTNASEIKQWLDQLKKTQATYGADHSLAKEAVQRVPACESILRQKDAITTLRELSHSKLLAEIYRYFIVDQTSNWKTNCYYGITPPQGGKDKYHSVEYIVNFAFKTKKRSFRLSEGQGTLSGQSVFGNRLRSELSTIAEGRSFTPQAYKILMAWKSIPAKTIDPIFKLLLLDRLLKALLPASQPLRDAFSQVQSDLDAMNFPWDTDWLSTNSKDTAVNAARRRAREFLSDLDSHSWEESEETIKASYYKIYSSKPKTPRTRWVGWMVHHNGRWDAFINAPGLKAELVVILNSKKTSKLHRIGRCDGHANLVIDNPTARQRGLPVYAIGPQP